MTLADLRARLEGRVADADRMGATAKVGDVLRVVLSELADADGQDAPGTPDRLLDVAAAASLGVRPRWLYDRARTLPFARKLGGRTLRFSEVGLRRWLARRRDG